MSAKSFACSGGECRLDSQPPGIGNDGVIRYAKYDDCSTQCGTGGAAHTPTPHMTPMPHATPLPRQPVYKPGHVVSFSCNNDCLPVSGVWPDKKTSFSTRQECVKSCGNTEATAEPGWGAGVIEGDEHVLPIALVGNIDRHILNFM